MKSWSAETPKTCPTRHKRWCLLAMKQMGSPSRPGRSVRHICLQSVRLTALLYIPSQVTHEQQALLQSNYASKGWLLKRSWGSSCGGIGGAEGGEKTKTAWSKWHGASQRSSVFLSKPVKTDAGFGLGMPYEGRRSLTAQAHIAVLSSPAGLSG